MWYFDLVLNANFLCVMSFLHEESICRCFGAQKPVGLEKLLCLVEGQHQVGVSSQRVCDTVAMPCSLVGEIGLVWFLFH